jgi:tetratricopeptide (TPR) repeat protein
MLKKRILTILLLVMSAHSMAQTTDTMTTKSGIRYLILKKGNGSALTPGWIAIWQYRLTLTDGTKVDASWDRSSPFSAKYPSNQIIPGVTEALSLMHIGDSAVFIIPSSLGYGDRGSGPIPPKATLVFDMLLLGEKEKSLQGILDSVLYAKPLADSAQPHMKEVLDTYEKLKKKGFENLLVSEDDFNNLGYQLLKKSPKNAVVFFEMNVKLYPDSWNAYDSLAEGYMNLGQNKRAVKYYEKSLQLNPNNKNAEEMLKKLKASKT